MNDLGCYRYCTMIWDMHDFEWTLEENIAHYSHMSEEISEEEILRRAKGREGRFKVITEFCQKSGVPLMSVRKYAHIPNSYGYPLKKIKNFFDKPIYQGGDYLNSALAQVLAYAIYRDFNRIDMFGINVEMGTEWVFQRDSVSYWMGLARGQGRIVTCSGSARRPGRIIDKNLYGFGIPQEEEGVEMIVHDPRKPNTYVKVYDESEIGKARYERALEMKVKGPHVKLWATDKKGVFVKAGTIDPSDETGAQDRTRRLPQDETPIKIEEAEASYRFSKEEVEADTEASVAVGPTWQGEEE